MLDRSLRNLTPSTPATQQGPRRWIEAGAELADKCTLCSGYAHCSCRVFSAAGSGLSPLQVSGASWRTMTPLRAT